MFIAFWNWFGPETTTSAYYYDHVDDFIKLWLLVHDTKWNCFFMISFFRTWSFLVPKKLEACHFRKTTFLWPGHFLPGPVIFINNGLSLKQKMKVGPTKYQVQLHYLTSYLAQHFFFTQSLLSLMNSWVYELVKYMMVITYNTFSRQYNTKYSGFHMRKESYLVADNQKVFLSSNVRVCTN